MEPILSKEEFREKMSEDRRITFELLDEQTRKVMMDPREFVALLDMLAQGVATTVSNTLLVQAQFPSASAVLPRDDWEAKGLEIIQDDRGYYPLGIRQFAVDGEYQGKDGKPHTRYKVYKGFDAAQTTDPELARQLTAPQRPSKVFINADPLHTMNRALFESSPVECIPYKQQIFIDPAENITEETGVKYIPETHTVVIRKIPQALWYPALTYEIALGLYHREEGSRFSREKHGLDAAVIAYLLSKRMGLSNVSFAFDPKQLPADQPLPAFRRRLQKCMDLTQALYHRVTEKLKRLQAPAPNQQRNGFFREAVIAR